MASRPRVYPLPPSSKNYEGGKKYIAEFSGLVFEAAKLKDSVAEKILEKNAEYVACRIRSAVDFLCEDKAQTIPVLFAGGVSNESDVLFPLIETDLPSGQCALERVETDVAKGALIRARSIYKDKTQK